MSYRDYQDETKYEELSAIDCISMFFLSIAIILTSLLCALWILVEFNIEEVINFIVVLFGQAPLFDSPRKPPSIDITNMSDVGSEAMSRRSRAERYSIYRNSCHFIVEEEANELQEGIIEEVEEEEDGFS
ncbi:Oidioi.mRNA.OKI2018_I69.chr2.g7348.t1.cds [Oikopleura dioica]|uniref:Oidioi.mRNA.OKI2018_I69.chr2.g7348.t1.cds n=1 Tax=Oikopleura dioica TaxID=34765 RepID=A0ABN7T6C7_OIKDI|nr:Oidioi.mRNA.OKI2018_I69.chr2.g7348.t1.cds [Oikopleura dioica]